MLLVVSNNDKGFSLKDWSLDQTKRALWTQPSKATTHSKRKRTPRTVLDVLYEGESDFFLGKFLRDHHLLYCQSCGKVLKSHIHSCVECRNPVVFGTRPLKVRVCVFRFFV